MTVTYSLEVSQTRFCGFAKLLARWKGSIYKILWKEFLIWSLGYVTLSVTYRCFLDWHQRAAFERVVLFVDSCTDFIPLSFVLGFYVSLVVGRWWTQYEAIPWPDRLCLMIASYVHGADERSRAIRRTLARYLILLQIFTFQAVSTSVKRRFPTTHHLVAAGMMTKEEQSVYEKINFVYGKWWLPCQWFSSLLMRAKKEGRIKDSILLDALFRELLNYRNSCGTMMSYDWISVPLVYTQVVTLATYVYAASLIIGRQYLDTSKNYVNHDVDLYVPFFTILQFIFYVGWLKVAEQIVNPYGEDDDDFELNWCVDRTVHVVYLIVDHMQTKHPRVSRDHFWDELEPKLPQTKHSAKGTENPQIGSAFHLEVEDTKYLPMDSFLEEDRDENIYSGDSVRRRSLGNIRSSFIMKVLGPAFGQSFRKKSAQREESAKNSSLQFRGGHGTSSVFFPDGKSGFSTPVASRKSSYRSHQAKAAASPAHSRSSSVSARRSSLGHQRYKSYNSHEGAEKQQLPNGNLPEPPDGHPAVKSAASVSEEPSTANDNTFTEPETSDAGGTMRQDIPPMPPIPEEPSRVASVAIMDCEERETESEPDVQSLVREAGEVLRELERTLTAGRHRTECESRGYESCCSLGSDDEDGGSEGEEHPSKPGDFAAYDLSGAVVV